MSKRERHHGDLVAEAARARADADAMSAKPDDLEAYGAFQIRHSVDCDNTGNMDVNVNAFVGACDCEFKAVCAIRAESDRLKAEIAGLLRADPLKAGVDQEREILRLRAVLTLLSSDRPEYFKDRGCGDGNCIVYKPEGQHTNGGCKCGTRYAAKDWAATKLRWAKQIAVEALKEK